MSSLVALVNSIFDFIVTSIVGMGRGLGPTWTLTAIAVVCGVILVYFYGKVSFQKQVKTVKNGIHAALLEVILFRHVPLLSLRAQGLMLLGGTKYLFLAFPPILAMMLPCIFLFAQLQAWFGYQAVTPGQSVIVQARTTESSQLKDLQLVTDSSVDVVGPLRDVAGRELTWKVTPKNAGEFPLTVNGGGLSNVPVIATQLIAGFGFPRIENLISNSSLDLLLYPSRSKIIGTKSGLERFEIFYPERELAFFGSHWHWLTVFLVLSMLSGIVGSKLLKVEL